MGTVSTSERMFPFANLRLALVELKLPSTDARPLSPLHKQSHGIPSLYPENLREADLHQSYLAGETALTGALKNPGKSFLSRGKYTMSYSTEFNQAQSPTQQQAIVSKCIQESKMPSNFRSNFFFINRDLKQRNTLECLSKCTLPPTPYTAAASSVCALKHWLGKWGGTHISVCSNYLRFTKNI